MQCPTSAVVGATLVLFNLFIGCGLAFMGWLLSVWMIDESVAVLSPLGWIAIGIKRTGIALLLAAVIGASFAVFNRFVYRQLSAEQANLPWTVAAAPGWLMAIGALVGGIEFVVEMPFM